MTIDPRKRFQGIVFTCGKGAAFPHPSFARREELFRGAIETEAVAKHRRAPHLDSIHLAEWRGGAFLHADDADILAACHEEGRIWLTYDQETVPNLLRQWAAEERPHAGVVFGDRNTVPPNNVKTVAVALAALVAEIREADTTHLIRYLRRAET